MNDRPTSQELIDAQLQFGLPAPALVEKDWFVVRALAAILAADKGPFQLVFQGGTALSRAHRVIERMSEDVDIKIVSEGVYVVSVDEGSAVQEAGIQEGDIIVSADRISVSTPAELARIMQEQKKGMPMLLQIRRGNSALFVPFG